jgi:hypothetical protein
MTTTPAPTSREAIEALVAKLNRREAKSPTEHWPANPDGPEAADAILALLECAERAERELERIAAFTEPHFKGAGLKAEAEWIIKEWSGRSFENENEIEKLEAALAKAEQERDTTLAALRTANEALEKFIAAKKFSNDGQYIGWRISGKGSVNEAHDAALAAREEVRKALEASHD